MKYKNSTTIKFRKRLDSLKNRNIGEVKKRYIRENGDLGCLENMTDFW